MNANQAPDGEGERNGEGDAAIIGLGAWHQWLRSPAGRYVLEWEQACYDRAVADLFGYVALQLSLPEIDTLRNNRIPSRLYGLTRADATGHGVVKHSLLLEDDGDLPFRDQSVDLVTLPHVIEFSSDPHQLLREVDRVLRPEGRVVLTGFNPISLWGIRSAVPAGLRRPFLPRESQMIALPRLRDWFKLLSFEFERGRYGCYRPPCRSDRWLERTRFMEAAGDRWWPICGALYSISAVKRVRAMRLVGPAWKSARRSARAVAVASPQFGPHESRVVPRRRRDDQAA
ncbi:MAG: class I SAM-dependent methyltransferase [Burkholderiaceae bacterium]